MARGRAGEGEALGEGAGLDGAGVDPRALGVRVQAAMDEGERRRGGVHYTNEADILKIIGDLFVEDLDRRIAATRALDDRPTRRARLEQLHEELASLRVLDPACGCGDFLIVTFRQLRRLELSILSALREDDAAGEHPPPRGRVNTGQFSGIELQRSASETARLGLRLAERQANLELAQVLGRDAVGPRHAGEANIVCANALRIDWSRVLSPGECDYIVGNPPFVGKKARTAAQNEDMKRVFGGRRKTGTLDYVCAWYLRAARYIAGRDARVAFVSTNSITQGEQPAVLWSALAEVGTFEIITAHRTFPWRSEVRGAAQVHVVIIGFRWCDGAKGSVAKKITTYEGGEGVRASTVDSIGPYLIPGEARTLARRARPVSKVPQARYGSMPNDGGNLILSDEDRRRLVAGDPRADRWVRPFLTAREFIAGTSRWCLWLVDAEPRDIRGCAGIEERVRAVERHRLGSMREATRALASRPARFGELRQPDSNYVLIPRHPSAHRPYIPMGYFTPEGIVGDSCICVPRAGHFHFGVLSSRMHLAWVRQVCGRIKSDFRYSVRLVYNNFPWPVGPSKGAVDAVSEAARQVLAARNSHRGASLAHLYDPLAMPEDLRRAHARLDREVDRCYRKRPFDTELERLQFLFDRLA